MKFIALTTECRTIPQEIDLELPFYRERTAVKDESSEVKYFKVCLLHPNDDDLTLITLTEEGAYSGDRTLWCVSEETLTDDLSHSPEFLNGYNKYAVMSKEDWDCAVAMAKRDLQRWLGA